MKKRVLSLFLALTLCLTLTPTGALAAEGQPPEQTVSVTQEAETDAGENASPANPEENPTENAPAAAEKNTADGETGKEPAAATGRDEPKADGSPSDDDAAKVQNQLVMAAAAGPGEPTMMGQNEPLALADEGQNAAEGRSTTAELTVNEAVVEAASVTKADGTERGTYASLPAALNAAQDGDTVKLLANHTTEWDAIDKEENPDYSTLAVVKKNLTLDLNGKSVDYLMVGELTYGEPRYDEEENETVDVAIAPGELTIIQGETSTPGSVDVIAFMSGKLTVQGGIINDRIECAQRSDAENITSETKYGGEINITGGTVCNLYVKENTNVTVTGGTGHAGNWLNDSGTLKIQGGKFDSVNFLNNGGTIAVSGGEFGTITNSDASSTIPLMPLLANGYAFYKDNAVQDATAKNLTDVTVGAHTHVPDEHGKCACGASIIASVKTADGTERTYGSFTDALAAAVESNDSTLQLLYNIDLGDTRDGLSVDSGSFTLDLNGKTLSGEVYNQLLAVSGTANITIKNGKLVNTFSKNSSDMNSGLANAVQITGGAVVLENVEITSGCGEYGAHTDAVEVDDGSLTVTSGTFTGAITVMSKSSDVHPTLKIKTATLHNGITYFTKNTSQPDYDVVKAFFADGSLLFDKDGKYIDITKAEYWESGSTEEYSISVFQYGKESIVKPHTHTIVNGKCDCGASYVASVTSNAQSTNYTSLDAALNAAQNGDTVTLLSDVDLGDTYVTINKSITFDLNGKTLSSSKTWSSDGVLLVKDAAVTVKNGTVNATGIGSCAIRAYRSGASMTLEAVTATVTSDKSSVMVGDFGSAVIKSGDYQGLYVGANSQVTLEGGTFRPYMDNITNENVKSIFWKVNETTDATSRDCMELLGDGCVYVDENRTQVRTGGGFNTVVTVQKGTAIDAPVAKIGDVEYASLSKAIDAVQNGGTITLLDDLDLGNGAVLQVGFSKKDFTIDLNSHTLSADGACLIMLHNGSQLTLKNGTLDGSRCMSYEGVLYISSNSGPKLTLENVTAKSGSVADFWNGQRSVWLAYVTYGTVVFDGGTYTGGVLLKTDGNAVLKSGTFRKGTNDYSIKTEDSGKHLSDYLDESLFWNGDTVLDLSSETQTADEVTVRPCEHKWENGKCTVCQKVCDHGSADGKSMTEDPCPTCGMKAAAQVDITGSDAKYFPSFTDALVYAFNNDGCTLKLLADVTGTTVMINNPFIFDLNGHSVDALSVNAKATIKDSGTTKGRIGKVTVSNEKVTDLTLGSLLEEGYAFKYGNGYWANDSYLQTTEGSFVTVEKAPIQSVNVYAKDKNNQKILNIAYGATGEVTLVSSCRMGETSGADLTYLWYKLEGAAATAPLEGATGANYTLPDNLAAGTHTYLLICTSDGYSKSAEITITVTPISLVGATVTVSNLTYNGNPQEPTVTVKLGDETLSRDNDYTVQVTKQTDAGSYKLTIKGGGNYSGEIKDVEWKIEPMKIDSVMVSSGISKTYDGTATVTKTAEEWAKVLTFKTLSASGGVVVDVPSEAYTISDAYFVEKSGEETIHSPDAGKKYGITFKIALKSSNYVLQNYYDKEPATAKEYTQSGDATFAIAQADAPTNIRNGALNVINGTKLKYTYDAKQLLPDAPKGTYGNVSYNCRFSFNLENGYYVDDIAIDDSVLTLTIDALNGGETGKIGTIPVYVTTDNYESFDLPLDLYAVDKITPVVDGDITASNITYSDELSKSTISGKMKNPTTGDEVKGTFAWTDGTIKPAASDNYEAEWTFTPAAGYEEYVPATGTVTVKVNKATPTFTAPTAQENLTYTGQEQALITAGMTDHGTMQYSLTENGTYSQDIPTGTDAGAYTVWYRVIGDANHNDTAPASVAVSIGKKPLPITGVTVAPKPYDGTTNADISSVTFDNVTLKRDTDYTVTASFDDAGVGSGKNVTATVTLKGQAANNYALEQSSFTTTGSITKAAAPTVQPVEMTIYNGVQGDYSVDLPPLPELGEGKTYGTVKYNNPYTNNLSEGYIAKSALGADLEKNTFRLLLRMTKTGSLTEEICTVTIPVTTDNYQNINLTVKVKAANQTIPEKVGNVSADAITYGQALSASTITGTMQDPTTGDAVNGTFTWDKPAEKLKAGSHDAKWTFTPDKSYGGKYTTNTGTATVTVNPKAVTVSGITAKDKVYDGNTDAVLDCSNAKFDGILENDTLTVTATGTFVSANAGKQKVKISGFKLGGDSAANYVPSTENNQTETTATITAKEVIVTITPNGGTYGSVTAAAAVLSGAVDGETVPVTLTYTGNGYNSTTVPTNAGSYTVTASIADSNYVLTGKTTANFVIKPKSIKDAKVVLGKGLIANGAEQTQTVEKVLLDGKELPADSYTVAGNTATDPGSHTLTITAKGNYTGTVKQTYVIAPAKAEDAPGEEIVIDSGKVKVVVKSEGAVPPATLLTDKAELLAMLVDSGDITADELAQIADGASVDIVLTVKEANVSAEIKTAMAKAAKGCTIGQYLDISLFKYMTVNGKQQDGVALRTTKNALTISVAVPDALINTNSAVNRTYCIVRRHDGAITVLDAAFDAASKTLTFKTNRFSIYAIAYKDTAVPSSGSNPSSNNSSNDSENKKNEVAAPTPAPASTSKPSTITAMPQTGDTSNPTLYVVLLVASLLGLAVVFVCKKRNDK